MICDQCNGKGILDEFYKYIVDEDSEEYLMTKMCDKCLGEGHLDWLENITGKTGMVPKNDDFHMYADIISHPSTTYHGGPK